MDHVRICSGVRAITWSEPNILGDACLVIEGTRELKEHVAQTVQEDWDIGADERFRSEPKDLAFGAAANSPGQIDAGRCGRAAGQDEVLQWR